MGLLYSQRKDFVKHTAYEYWTTLMSLSAAGKSSLKYLNTTAVSPSTAHHMWPREGCSSRKRVAASYRANMVSGS